MEKTNSNFVGVLCLFVLLVFPIVSAQVDYSEEISAEEQQAFDAISEPIMKVYKLVKYLGSVIAVLVQPCADLYCPYTLPIPRIRPFH
jgi:hypothetical protein